MHHLLNPVQPRGGRGAVPEVRGLDHYVRSPAVYRVKVAFNITSVSYLIAVTYFEVTDNVGQVVTDSGIVLAVK